MVVIICSTGTKSRKNNVGYVILVDLAVAIIVGQIEDDRQAHDLVELGVDLRQTSAVTFSVFNNNRFPIGIEVTHALARPMPFEHRFKRADDRARNADIGVGIHVHTGVCRVVAVFVKGAGVAVRAGFATHKTFLKKADLRDVITA